MDSEKQLFEDLGSKKIKEEKVTRAADAFKDQVGNPANEHAKKLAKEKSSKKKEATTVFYTKDGNKILRLKYKAKGRYSEYVTTMNKKNKKIVDSMIVKFKEDGCWLEPHEVDQKSVQSTL